MACHRSLRMMSQTPTAPGTRRGRPARPGPAQPRCRTDLRPAGMKTFRVARTSGIRISVGSCLSVAAQAAINFACASGTASRDGVNEGAHCRPAKAPASLARAPRSEAPHPWASPGFWSSRHAIFSGWFRLLGELGGRQSAEGQVGSVLGGSVLGGVGSGCNRTSILRCGAARRPWTGTTPRCGTAGAPGRNDPRNRYGAVFLPC